MKLGDLIERLDELPADTRVALSGFGSYRIYARHGVVTRVAPEDAVLVGELLEQARAAVGGTFEHWKGWELTMSEDTPLYVADHYSEPGDCLVGLKETESKLLEVETFDGSDWGF